MEKLKKRHESARNSENDENLSFRGPHQKRRTYLHIQAPPPLPGEVYYIHTGLTWYTDQAPQAAPLAPSIVIVSKTECVQKNEVSISVKLSSSVQTTHAMAAKKRAADVCLGGNVAFPLLNALQVLCPKR